MATTNLPFREFAYLDREKVEDFLSALIGGLPTERTDSGASQSSALDAGVITPLGSIGRRGGSQQITWEEMRQATPASLFQELYRQLQDHGTLQILNAFDEAIWEQIGAGEFVECECKIGLSAVEELLDLFQKISQFML